MTSTKLESFIRHLKERKFSKHSVRIVKALIVCGCQMTYNELHNVTGIRRSSLTRPLKTLSEIGILSRASTKKCSDTGRTCIAYQIAPDVMTDLLKQTLVQ